MVIVAHLVTIYKASHRLKAVGEAYDKRKDLFMKEQARMVQVAYNALDEKKGEDIKIIDISGISVIADYFVIANGNNISQVQALVDNVEEKMLKAGFEVKRIEGNKSSTWVLMDFGDVVIHVFDSEDRLFYDLERIWTDGKIVDVETLGTYV